MSQAEKRSNVEGKPVEIDSMRQYYLKLQKNAIEKGDVEMQAFLQELLSTYEKHSIGDKLQFSSMSPDQQKKLLDLKSELE